MKRFPKEKTTVRDKVSCTIRRKRANRRSIDVQGGGIIQQNVDPHVVK